MRNGYQQPRRGSRALPQFDSFGTRIAVHLPRVYRGVPDFLGISIKFKEFEVLALFYAIMIRGKASA